MWISFVWLELKKLMAIIIINPPSSFNNNAPQLSCHAFSHLNSLSSSSSSSHRHRLLRQCHQNVSQTNIVGPDDDPKCESWKFSIEVNNAGSWNSIPRPCIEFVKDYFHSGRYLSDSRSVAAFSLTFARSVKVAKGDGMNAWIFDVDETLLSNLPYYEDNGFG